MGRITPLAPLVLAATLLLGACADSADSPDLAVDADTAPGSDTAASSDAAAGSDDAAAPATTTAPTAADGAASAGDGGITEYRAEVIATYPHDTGAYTQGLEFFDGVLLESTGRTGESTIRLVEPSTGEVIRSTALDAELFGEGATVVDDEVWQLTYRAETLLVRDADDLAEVRTVPYRGEGWGLCDDGQRVIMSNGSSELTFRDRSTFDVIDSVTVLEDGQPVELLNELECVAGLVWANIFQEDRIVAIDPGTGDVVGRVDATALVPEGYAGDANNVLNGIAVDPATGRFWLTGKRWPVMYEVELEPIG